MNSLNDFELVGLAQEGNDIAMDALYKKYIPIINNKAKRVCGYLKDKGLEFDDIVQECLVSFYDAVKRFDSRYDDLFYSFVNLCIDRALNSLIRNCNCLKNKYLNDATPLESLDDDYDLIDLVGDNSINPEIMLCDYDEYNYLWKKIISKLTPMEECVLILKIDGFSYEDMSLILDKNEKSIHNAMHRIRVKVGMIDG